MSDSLMADLRQQAAEVPESTPIKEALIPRKVTFKISHTSRGQTQSASVTSTVPDGKARARVERAMARQTAGLSWESFPANSRIRMAAVALVAHQISDVPAWLDAALLEDDDLLFALYEEAEDHTLRYFRGDEEEGAAEASVHGVAVALVDWRP